MSGDGFGGVDAPHGPLAGKQIANPIEQEKK